jgi:hypothetical protein
LNTTNKDLLNFAFEISLISLLLSATRAFAFAFTIAHIFHVSKAFFPFAVSHHHVSERKRKNLTMGMDLFSSAQDDAFVLFDDEEKALKHFNLASSFSI